MQTKTSVWQGIGAAISKHSVLFVYVILLMTAFIGRETSGIEFTARSEAEAIFTQRAVD